MTEYVLVEAVEPFRTRYLVPVPDSRDEWALDTVVMDEAVQFSSKFIDESIISHRIVSKEDAIRLCDEDNDYAAEWTEDKKIETFFTPEINEDGDFLKDEL